jgi:hypothetical protein
VVVRVLVRVLVVRMVLARDLDEVDRLVVVGRDVVVVPPVRVVLPGGADPLASPCGEVARASQHHVPPPAPEGPSMITLALREDVLVVRRAELLRAVPR